MPPKPAVLPATQTAPGTETLQEYASSSGATLRVDREKCVVQGVKILGLESKNGRSYKPECVAKALPLYEGAAVFFNHGKPGDVRGYQDRCGVLQNIRAAADGLYADHAYNPKHPLTEQYLWDAEHAPANVGFSHDVQAKTSRRDGKVVVESIAQVASVDLVARPATTNGLFEGEIETQTPPANGDGSPSIHSEEQSLMGIEYKDLTLESLKEHRSDLVEQLTGTDAVSKLQGELKTVNESLTATRTELAAMKAEKAATAKTAAIAEELKAAKIDTANKTVCTEAILAQLQAAPDAAARKPLVDLMVLASRPAAGSPITGAAPLGPITETASGKAPGTNVKETLERLRS